MRECFRHQHVILQVEQDLVCSSGTKTSLDAAYKAVADLINDARLTDDDRQAAGC